MPSRHAELLQHLRRLASPPAAPTAPDADLLHRFTRQQEEAAAQLGWTPGSGKGRLERGRKRLHARLARRGLTLAAALAALAASRGVASAGMVGVMVRAAVAFAAGGEAVTAGGLSARVVG